MKSSTKPRWQLLVSDAKGLSRSFELSGETLTLGKSQTCDLVLADERISREHCTLQITNDGIEVTDLESTNGTYVQGQRQDRFIIQCPQQGFALGPYLISIDHLDTGDNPFHTDRGLALLKRLHLEFINGCDQQLLKNREATQAALKTYLNQQHPLLPLWCQRPLLESRLRDEICGLGPLQTIFDDPSVSEIMVNGASQVFVIRRGRIQPTPERFIDNDSVTHCIQRIIAPLGRSLDDHNPMVDARIPNQARINAIIAPLSLVGPCLTIRKSGSHHLTAETLVQNGALSVAALKLLQYAVQSHCNIIVAGGTDTGKTTILNILSSYIAADERIITIEDTAELKLRQQHVVTLETRPANLEGCGAITIRDLVRNALRMRPNRLVVGECRGGEALDMLQAMNTGHDGSMTTLHANTARDTLSRLETMSLMAGLDLPVRSIREQIAAAIDLIVFLERHADGQRRISRITEVGNMEEQVITSQDIFVRTAEHGLQPTGIVPNFFANQGGAHVELLLAPAN